LASPTLSNRAVVRTLLALEKPTTATVGMSQVGRARWVVAGGNLGRVFDVVDHKVEGASSVVLGTLVPCLGLGVLEPIVEVSSRVVGEGVGEDNCRGRILRHGGWVDGWMGVRL
jgi:hypothetical protein